MDTLTSLSSNDNHQVCFLKSHISALFRAANHSELFGIMNFHWNYLNPGLLNHLVQEFHLEEVKVKMEAYKSDLQQFRMSTPLMLFCQTQQRKRIKLTPEFLESVFEFDWPEKITLETVEQFRQEYASHYSLQECALMISKVLGKHTMLVNNYYVWLFF